MNASAKISIGVAVVGLLVALGQLLQILERRGQAGPKREMAVGDSITFVTIVVPLLLIGFGTALFAGRLRRWLLLVHLLILGILASLLFRIGT